MTNTTLPGPAPLVTRPLPAPPQLDIVIPVHNEERDLGPCVRRLHAHLARSMPYPARITIADNASTDATATVAQDLAETLDDVRVVRVPEKGRGRALSAVWSVSDSPVLVYMDVDLSTDLNALLPLVAPLISGHSDVAIGTRLSRAARVVRGPRRELISRCYNLILRGALATRFSDAQCGFKAIRADVALRLLPMVQDTAWFFDTELLVLAERAGLRIHEVPVDWIDDADSRVDVVTTALADLRGIARLGRGLLTGATGLDVVRASVGRRPLRSGGGLAGQMIRFAGVGILATLATTLIFLALRPGLGAQAANAAAWIVTGVGSALAHRRYTFGIHGPDDAVRHHVQGIGLFALGLGLTSGSLAALYALIPDPATALEVTVLVAANVAAALTKFLALRHWVFRRATVPTNLQEQT